MRSTALLVCALLALLATPAQAANDCYLRLAHLSPDTPAVDVTVTSFSRPDWSVTIKAVAYGALSGYQRVEAGTYTVSMRAAGADPTSKPVISTTFDGTTGRAYTVAGLGKHAELALDVLDDDISLPPANQARVRVVNAAPLAGELTVKRDSTTLTDKAKFGVAGAYQLVPAGKTVLNLTSTQGAMTELPVALDAGSVYSVLVLEHDGVLTAEARQDAKGAAVVPTGGIETGYGWSAPTWSPVLLALAAAAGGGLVLVLRRRRTA